MVFDDIMFRCARDIVVLMVDILHFILEKDLHT